MTDTLGSFLMPLSQLSVFARSDRLDSNSRLVPDESRQNGHDAANVPDIEIMPIPFTCSLEMPTRSVGVLTFLTTLAQPYSRGSVRIQSTDPRQRPACDLGYFTDPRDWSVVRKAIELAMALGEQVRKTGYAIKPWRVMPENASEEQFKAFVAQQARACYHYASTCRMGREEDPKEPGVVDADLRVHGIDGLRIADCSIFPNIISTHLQAAAVMVAERCADMLNAARR